jgi:hypothetical protein
MKTKAVTSNTGDGAMNKSSAGLLLLQVLMMSACSTVIPYEPTANLTREEARATLTRAFEEQPEKVRPVAVEIGDDAIRLGFSTVRSTFLTGALATVDKRETYYFSNLADLRLVQNKGRWQVDLSNRERSVRRWVLFYNQKRATDFLDAMSRMARRD